MYGQDRQYRVGGGCKSIFKSDMNTPNHRRDLAGALRRMEDDRERRLKERAAWLKTPEGIAHTKAEADRAQKQIEEELRAREEQRKQLEHANKCAEVYDRKPAVCSKVTTLQRTTSSGKSAKVKIV